MNQSSYWLFFSIFFSAITLQASFIAPYEEMMQYAYWHPVGMSTIEKQLQELEKKDKDIGILEKEESSFLLKFKKNRAIELKNQIDQLCRDADSAENDILKLMIPKLMQQKDEQSLANPTYLKNHPHRSELSKFITSPKYNHPNDEFEIANGPYFATLQIIKKYYPQFDSITIFLKHRMGHEYQRELANNGIDKKTGLPQIALLPDFYTASDANKLHTLLHELQHILYNDSNHSYLFTTQNTNELHGMTEILFLKKIIKGNGRTVKDNISRYQEWRCDTQALCAMQCPYCIIELGLESLHSQRESSSTPGLYHERGYLETWQMLKYVDELYEKQTICRHHLENNKQANLDFRDGSSLLNRLEIIQNYAIAPEDRLTIKMK